MGGTISEIGGLLGNSPEGINYQAQGIQVAQPTSQQQVGQAYNYANAGLNQQQQLINALQAQNGIQNQSQVYNQLQGVANGTGPNPALAQLQQQTGTNVANQAALMAGQRGASANAGLIARQAAQQGAATQQQAVGQGATLQAQQQLNALGQLGGIANQQVAQQTGATGAYNQAAQNEQQQLLGGINSQNQSNVALQQNLNNANAGMAQTNANNAAKATSGFLGSISGGLVQLASGGEVNPKMDRVSFHDRFPPHMKGAMDIYHPEHLTKFSHVAHYDDGGGIPQPIANTSPISDYQSPISKLGGATGGGGGGGAEGEAGGASSMLSELGPAVLLAKAGGKIPGKAPLKGDHRSNDTVPAMLSPGEFVIPKSIMESEDPAAGAAKMIAEHQKKNGNHHEMQSDFKSALQRAIQQRKKK